MFIQVKYWQAKRSHKAGDFVHRLEKKVQKRIFPKKDFEHWLLLYIFAEN